MKTVEISEATQSLAEYAKQVGNGAVVVLRKGKPVAVLSSAEGLDSETIAVANDPGFISVMDKSRSRQKAEGGLTSRDVRKRLGIPARRHATKRPSKK